LAASFPVGYKSSVVSYRIVTLGVTFRLSFLPDFLLFFLSINVFIAVVTLIFLSSRVPIMFGYLLERVSTFNALMTLAGASSSL